MQGTIKRYDPQIAAGIIIGNDKNLYKLSEEEWWASGQPSPRQKVEFIDFGDTALAVVPLQE